MPKQKQFFECQKCGAQFPKWQGQCTECNAWNTLEEIEYNNTSNSPSKPNINDKAHIPLKTVAINDITFKEQDRTKTQISEFDRVLGGGFVKGQAILVAGEPGIGKSTLLLQVADKSKHKVYYLCGEESPYQVKQRYSRLKLTNKNIELLENASVETIADYLINQDNPLIIVDSVNSLFSAKYKSSAGTISQIKETSQILVNTAKSHGIPIILVGQINKEGDIAGPKTLEHLVDTVLIIEGDDNHTFRVLRSIKNRFGSVNEVGLFTMDENGMNPVLNPSEYLLSGKLKNASGSVISIINEGSRSYAVEVQALVNKTNFGYPKRTSNGFSLNRLNLLSAVISKRTKYNLNDYDIYLNIASGLKVTEPAIDLAVCVSIVSALINKSISDSIGFFGEVGLNAEIRPVKMTQARINESKAMGIKKLYYAENSGTLNDLFNAIIK